jgi:hypothetical protein
MIVRYRPRHLFRDRHVFFIKILRCRLQSSITTVEQTIIEMNDPCIACVITDDKVLGKLRWLFVDCKPVPALPSHPGTIMEQDAAKKQRPRGSYLQQQSTSQQSIGDQVACLMAAT